MKANRNHFAVERMSKALKVQKSSFYKWLEAKESARSLENKELTNTIKSIFSQSKSRYGSPKITQELRKRGIQSSRPRVARLMRLAGLRSIIRKKYRVCTTDSNHNYPVAPNLLERNFKAEGPAQVWVSDLTYVHTAAGWLYLTIVMDLFDRKIVGWALSKTMTTEDTIMAAWKMSLSNRPIGANLVFHSDRGIQYASNKFRKALKAKSAIQSMSRKGDCWDNAVAESFFKILKSEMVYHMDFQNRLQAKIEIFEFIEIWYNRQRIHSYLGYLSPEEFGNIYFLKAA